MTIRANLETLKQVHKENMVEFSNQVDKYIIKYGNDECDYLRYRQDMAIYHRGAYDALVELEMIQQR